MGLQMIHCHSSHWVTACKEDSSSEVKVYDSLFDLVDNIIETVIMNVLKKMAQMQKQTTKFKHLQFICYCNMYGYFAEEGSQQFSI